MMNDENKKDLDIKPRYKIWLEMNKEPLLGEGGAKLLLMIDKYNSIADAANVLNISYRFAWNYIRKIERKTKRRIVYTKRGGATGGKTTLTQFGKELMKKYFSLKAHMALIFNFPELWYGSRYMKTKVNVLKGTIVDKKALGDSFAIKIKIDKGQKVSFFVPSQHISSLQQDDSNKKTRRISISPLKISIMEYGDNE